MGSYDKIMENEEIKTALDAQFIDVFSTAAGVAKEFTEIIYGEGSLLVTAKITSPEPLDDSNIKLPDSSTITAAVKEVPKIGEAVIPGEEVGSVAPVGIRYPPDSEDSAASAPRPISNEVEEEEEEDPAPSPAPKVPAPP